MLTGHRVVITGMGVLAPNGVGLDEFWRTLLAGESGIRKIAGFNATSHAVKVAGEVQRFDLRDYVESATKPRRMGRHTQLGLAASALGLKDAGLDPTAHPPLSVIFGVSTGAIDIIAAGKGALTRHGPSRVSPYSAGACQPHAISKAISDYVGGAEKAWTVSSACRAGLDAITAASRMVQSGEADMVITGGADSPTDSLTVASLHASGLVPSTNGDDPRTLSRPFDLHRKGGIIAEGGGCLIVERLESALARGARVYAEITGSGTADDPPGGKHAAGLERSMQLALADAGKVPRTIGYICAHGPSDTELDKVETGMIKRVFGDAAFRIPVSSIKGTTGNPLSAAGPLQVIACALAMRDDMLPPTANYTHPDPECDLDYIGEGARPVRIDSALINGHGMGGGNTTIVLERVTAA